MKATAERKGYSVAALRALARKELPRMLFDMVDGAAGDEITMRNNEAALAAIELVPKLLAGAPTRDQSVELFGAEAAVARHHRADRASPGSCGRTPNRRGARGGAVRDDLLHEPRLDRDPRGDRRRDAGAEMDAGLSLQGPRPHRGIRRPRRRRRLSRRSSSPSTIR